jgi:hypothetical protein
MSKVRWFGQLSLFAVVTAGAFYAAAPFRHTSLNLLLVLSPILIVFAAVPALRTLVQESGKLATSFTWWHGLWFFLFLSGLVFRVRDESDIHQSAIDGWAAFRIGLDALIALVLVQRLVTGRTTWLRALFGGLIGIMAIYPLLGLVSSTWSVAQAFTLFRSVEYLLDLSLLAAIVMTLDSVEAYESFANWTWTLLGLLVLSAWIGAIVDPADGLLEGYSYGPIRVRLEGVCPILDANSIGEYCAILAGIALCRLLDDPERKYDRGWYRFLFAASVITLIFTQTRAAVAAFIFAVILIFVATRRFLLGALAGATASLGGLILLTFTNFGDTIGSFLLRGQSVAEAEGLSGRAELWQFALQKIAERPWTGYGGYAGGRFVVLPGLGIPGKSDVLSTLVEALLDLGVWGPAALIAVFLGIWWCLIRASRISCLNPQKRHLALETMMAASVVSLRSIVAGNITSHAALAFLTVLGCSEFLRRQLKISHGFVAPSV